MKPPKKLIDDLARGMLCHPWQLDFEPRIMGGWEMMDDVLYYCTPFPQHQGHWHALDADTWVEKPGDNWMLYRGDRLIAVLSPIATAAGDVSGMAEEFARYRASLAGRAASVV